MIRRRLLLALIFILVVSSGLAVYKILNSYHYDNSLDPTQLAVTESEDVSIVNIALFGVDARHGETSRSDAMMIMSIDGEKGQVKLTSLMRDSYVQIDGHGGDRLCHAYAYGGPELAIKTINQNFGSDITEYATVNFDQMSTIIDAIGGVEIDVSEAERRETNRVLKEYAAETGIKGDRIKKAGSQTLNGVQAMNYGRIRKGNTGDDWGRAERQSIVLEAIFSKVKTMSTQQALMLLKDMLPHVTTSLSISEMTGIAAKGMKKGMPNLEHIRLPLGSMWKYEKIDGAEYITYDVSEAAKLWKSYVYEDIDPTLTEKQTDAEHAPPSDGEEPIA